MTGITSGGCWRVHWLVESSASCLMVGLPYLRCKLPGERSHLTWNSLYCFGSPGAVFLGQPTIIQNCWTKLKNPKKKIPKDYTTHLRHGSSSSEGHLLQQKGNKFSVQQMFQCGFSAKLHISTNTRPHGFTPVMFLSLCQIVSDIHSATTSPM